MPSVDFSDLILEAALAAANVKIDEANAIVDGALG
jgi:hypothetical protein